MITPDRLSAEAALPPIVHRRGDPLFVVGHGRSGTSILTNLIRRYLRVAFGTESQFFVRFERRLASYGDLHDARNLRALVDDIAAERFFVRSRKYNLELDIARVCRDAEPRSYAGVLTAIFSQFAESQNMARWGDKTPEYSHHLPVLHRLFPTAQYIHVVRDGRDVALSGYHVHFGAKNAYTAAAEWQALLQKVARDRAALPAGAMIEVRYEDLLSQPAAVFQRLIEFLAIDDPGGNVSRAVGACAAAELRADNFGKWRHELTPREQAVFAAVAGDSLRAYGYEAPVSTAAPGPLARLYWSADNHLRRMAVPAYWRDNIYKAGVRLRAYTRTVRRRQEPATPDRAR